MAAKRLPFEQPQTTAELLNERLELIHQWYQGMVHPATGMLEYTYVPQTNRYIRKKCPIRDIGSVWDVELLERFLKKEDLLPVIEKSLNHYEDYLLDHNGYLILDPSRLGEPSSIAHSAFMMLALLNSPPPRRIQQITALADGILRQQRPDGSYKVYFDELPDQGEELYAGEAMLALLTAYEQYQDIRYLPSVERAVSYYDSKYFQRGLVDDDVLVFFANWQTQVCRLLFQYVSNDAVKRDVADYIYRMHDAIIAQGFYEGTESHPAEQVSVEVACALEGLNDAFAVAHASDNERSERYRQNICICIDYLVAVQRTKQIPKKERGGFGMSLEDRTQRIDVTGHAASGFMKSVANRIVC